MKNNTFVVAGHAALDMTPAFDSDSNTTASLQDIIQPGKLIDVGNLAFTAGGCVSNTGIALRRFGADVTLMCKVGKDQFAKIIQETYQSYDCKTSLIHDESEMTSYTIIIAPPGSDRFFLHNSGTNNSLKAKDLDFDIISKAGFFHFGYPTVMREFFINEGKELVTLFKKVKSMGIITSMDVAGIDPQGKQAKLDWHTILTNTLPYVDFFTPSFEELCFMLDKERYFTLKKKAQGEDICKFLSLKNDVEPLAKKALSLGCRAVLLKCGAAGMYLTTADTEAMNSVFTGEQAKNWASVSLFEESFLPDVFLSGTGAGDTSIASFLFNVSQDKTPKECLSLAVATGTVCLGSYDAFSALQDMDVLEKKIANGWEKEHHILP